MLAGFITLSSGFRIKFVHVQNATVFIAVLLIMNIRIHCQSTLELIQWFYRLQEFTSKWLQNSNSSYYRPVSQHRTNRPLCSMSWKYWSHSVIGQWGCHRGVLSHWISLSQYTMTCLITWMVLFKRWLRRRLSGWKTSSSLQKLAWQKLSKYYAELTPSTCMLFIPAKILHCFHTSW